jgi:hypothetical protein
MKMATGKPGLANRVSPQSDAWASDENIKFTFEKTITNR